MLQKQFRMIAGVALISFVSLVACRPSIESADGTTVPLAEIGTRTNQVQSNDKGAAVVNTPPITATELVTQSSGQATAGAASGEVRETPTVQDEQQPETELVYVDSMYKFSVNYPANFVVRAQPIEKFADLKPKPASLWRFMSPVIATSALGDSEPANLEVRVYVTGQSPTLESWLTTNGLVGDGAAAPKLFQAANTSGLEVCASIMVAPGCSYFIGGRGRIYQLTPGSLEGETMAHTFMLIP